MKASLEKNISAIRKKYKKSHEITALAKAHEDRMLKLLQEECGKERHPYVAEVPYEPGTSIGNPSLPFRICEVCGIREEGSFYKILTSKRVRVITRDESRTLWNPIGEIEY